MSGYWLKPRTDHLPHRWQPCDVYFIQNESGAIKIGMTGNVKRRIKLLRTSSPEKLTLIMVMHGPRMLEKMLHFRFRHLNIKGEWFEPGDDLLEFLADRARNGWSLTEQQKWMGEVGEAIVAHDMKEAEEWLRTYRESENCAA